MNQTRNHRLIIDLVVLLVVFSAFIQKVLLNSATSLVNEFGLFVLIAISITGIYKRKALNKKHLLVFGLYLFFLSISFGSKYSSSLNIIAQSFMHLELFYILIALSVAQRDYNWNPLRIFRIISLISLLGAIISFFQPELFPEGDSLDPLNKYRIQGFQLNSNALGILLAYYIFFLIQSNLVGKNRFEFIMYLLVIFLTGSRSAILILLIGFVFSNQSKLRKALVAFSFITIFAIFGSETRVFTKSMDNVQQISNAQESNYIRAILLLNAYDLAIDNFPFGTGAGSYASALSRNSDLYSKLGLMKHQAIREGKAINDSNAAAIIGELGILGFLLMYSLFIYFVKYFSKGISVSRKRQIVIPFLLIGFLAPFLRGFFSSTYYSVIFSLALFSILSHTRSIYKNNSFFVK